jgi:hypothetical protein
MKNRFELELDVITDLSPLELALRIAPLVREAVEAVRQSLGAESDNLKMLRKMDSLRFHRSIT